MLPEEILTTCIAALEAGEDLDEVLARYPDYVAELEPILRAVAALRGATKPRLSGPGFVRGREELAAALAAHHAALEDGRPPASVDRLPVQTTRPLPTAGAVIPALPAPRTTARRFSWPSTLAGIGVALAALLAVVVFAGSGGSLPGSPLYTLKRAGESLQGVIMTSAGSEADWLARQVERRLVEALALEAQGQFVDAAFLAEIEQTTREALVAANELPASERARFLLTWQQNLQSLKADPAGSSLVGGAVEAALAGVTAALDAARAPATVLPMPVTATPTASPTDTPAATPTAGQTATAAVTELPAAPPATPPDTATPLPAPTEEPVPTAPPCADRDGCTNSHTDRLTDCHAGLYPDADLDGQRRAECNPAADSHSDGHAGAYRRTDCRTNG